ncbi:kinase-like protein [Hypoxylon sp. FL1857]|nr:kinase-like protein [Hypoxylon sp. FL1857]
MATVDDDVNPPHDIQAFTDLDGATGVYNEGEPDGEYTTFWKFYRNGEAYFAQIFKPRPDVNIAERYPKELALRKWQQLKGRITSYTSRDLPFSRMRPPNPASGFVTFSVSIWHADCLATLSRQTPLVTLLDIVGEAQIMEQVSSIQHKNIIQYYGCLKRDGRLAGIVLERHKCTLTDFFMWQMDKDKDKNGTIDSQRFMEELESAILHLHQAGLAHNDLKPSNILLDKDNLPVLIDFGSCRPFGERLMEGGTPGWCNPEKLVMFSDKEHDLFSLDKIREWLTDPDRALDG